MAAQYIDRMHELMDASGERNKEKFLSFFAPDVEYIPHTSARAIKGLDWLARFLDRYFEDMTDVTWHIGRWAQNGDKLLVEGYEEYREAAGGKRVGHPYMGIVEFNSGGKITAMRDYFEMKGKPLDD